MPVGATREPCRRCRVSSSASIPLTIPGRAAVNKIILSTGRNRRSRKRLGVECMPQLLDFLVTRAPGLLGVSFVLRFMSVSGLTVTYLRPGSFAQRNRVCRIDCVRFALTGASTAISSSSSATWSSVIALIARLRHLARGRFQVGLVILPTRLFRFGVLLKV